jgi:SAM-dependent methyltransferase
MNVAQQPDDEQARLWNGPAGRGWVEARHVLEEMFRPFEDLLVQVVSEAAASCVLDVGCGTGATTLAVARALGSKGYCTGIDLSEPMIAVARARAALDGQPASFICADAQTHAFAPASFDMIISRLGVMFFADPVQAFANLRQAARPDARLRFIAWRGAAENPFMTTAERAAKPLLPDLPARRPEGPGSSPSPTGAGSRPFWRRVAGQRSTSGRSMSSAAFKRRNSPATSAGLDRSACSFRGRMKALAHG